MSDDAAPRVQMTKQTLVELEAVLAAHFEHYVLIGMGHVPSGEDGLAFLIPEGQPGVISSGLVEQARMTCQIQFVRAFRAAHLTVLHPDPSPGGGAETAGGGE